MTDDSSEGFVPIVVYQIEGNLETSTMRSLSSHEYIYIYIYIY